MNLFKWKVSTPIIQNGNFDQQKGNLFEYIEAAKFNTDAASKGMSAKAIVTDTYDQGAAADICEQQYSYQNLYVVGCIKESGILVNNIDDVITFMKKVAPEFGQEFN